MIEVSFVVIAYNEERNIERAVRSIAAQQDLSDFEVVVVNDGSRDRTLTIIRGLAETIPQLRIIDQPNQGRGAARAAGVAAARGRYIAFIDADIVLPRNWLARCLPYMKEYDACGGIAVPDGDATFIYRVCGLRPKAAPQTTMVTGNNGLFKRAVFEKVGYNAGKKNGEDVALGHAMVTAGLKALTVPGLVVDHRETKSYGESVRWLLESGIGASRQLYEYRQLRLPDMAFVGFLGLMLGLILSLIFSLFPVGLGLLLLFCYISLGSFLHLRGKFYLAKTPLRSLAAVFINDSLIAAYYLGRFIGTFTEFKR